jgi:hypothetical protein
VGTGPSSVVDTITDSNDTSDSESTETVEDDDKPMDNSSPDDDATPAPAFHGDTSFSTRLEARRCMYTDPNRFTSIGGRYAVCAVEDCPAKRRLLQCDGKYIVRDVGGPHSHAVGATMRSQRRSRFPGAGHDTAGVQGLSLASRPRDLLAAGSDPRYSVVS